MTVDALLIAGERMFADRGADVPLREIAIAAGQRNNSAVQYHFGDRQGLIAAIVRRRLQSVEASGARLLVGVDRSDTHALVEVLVASLVDTSVEQGSTHYFRFLEVMRTQVKGWPAGEDTTWSMITNTLAELLPEGTRRERISRISSMATTLFALLADFERAHEGDDRFGPTQPQIVEMLVGLLRAPMHPR
jgi:AcrR family transcriptional regulator